MNRRDFVWAGVTAAGTLACARSLVQAAVPASAAILPVGTQPWFAVIVDRRFASARQFGDAAARRGHRVVGYDGDITPIWLRQIEPQWSRRAGALAGMTTAPALICLEQLAARHWLRVRARTHEQAGLGQSFLSWVIS